MHRLAKYERVTGRWCEFEDCARPVGEFRVSIVPLGHRGEASPRSTSRRGSHAELPGTARRAATMSQPAPTVTILSVKTMGLAKAALRLSLVWQRIHRKAAGRDWPRRLSPSCSRHRLWCRLTTLRKGLWARRWSPMRRVLQSSRCRCLLLRTQARVPRPLFCLASEASRRLLPGHMRQRSPLELCPYAHSAQKSQLE